MKFGYITGRFGELSGISQKFHLSLSANSGFFWVRTAIILSHFALIMSGIIGWTDKLHKKCF